MICYLLMIHQVGPLGSLGDVQISAAGLIQGHKDPLPGGDLGQVRLVCRQLGSNLSESDLEKSKTRLFSISIYIQVLISRDIQG